MDPPAASAAVMLQAGPRVGGSNNNENSISDVWNLDLNVDDYTASSFYRLLLQLQQSLQYPNSSLRNLRIIRSVSGQGRFRSTTDMQDLLHTVLGRLKIVRGSSYPLRMRPLALRSLQLDHVSEQDIASLPDLLRDHPSLKAFGLCLWPYRTRRLSSALVQVLQSMPKLRHLKVSVLRGSVLGGVQEEMGTLSRLRPKPAFAKLKILEVSLPRSKQVLTLMTELTFPTNTSLVLEELHLQTDAVVQEVAPAIADLIANTKYLEEMQLVFRTHPLDDKGCILLAKALARNKSLTYMGLGPWLCPVQARTMSDLSPRVQGISRRSGCQALVETMKQNMTLMSLTFQGGTWPGQESEEDECDPNSGSDSSDSSNIFSDERSSASEQDGDDFQDRLDLGEDSDSTSTVSSSSTTVFAIPSHPKLCLLDQAMNDSPSFPKVVSFYLELNRCGRGALLGTDRMATKEEWIEMLAQESHHIGRLFYFLSNNPSLFTI